MMSYNEFLDRIIDDGIAAAKKDYEDPLKRDGSIDGFELCRNQDPECLGYLLKATYQDMQAKFNAQDERYIYWSCRYAEVEWVCNCVSASLKSAGYEPIIQPTARGVLKAAEILGVF